MSLAEWDRRIDRAAKLDSVYPFAAEGLRFYSRVTEFQRDFYAALAQSLAESREALALRPLREQLRLPLLLPRLASFLDLIARTAPVPLAEAARGVRLLAGPARQQQMLEDFWYSGADEPFGDETEQDDATTASARHLAWIFLQPYAEYLANRRKPLAADGAPLTCPLCGGRPMVGVLRQEGDGAKKSLVCMLCACEWAFRRLYCPSCGEAREPQLAFYSSPEIAHVRVDVCDTCRTYLKTVDLTKAGLAIPVVDELATIPLDLWAREHGYRKLQINLLGT